MRRGAVGIAIIDNSGSKPFLRYVFDVDDTGGEPETRPRLWEYGEEHAGAVSAALEQRFDAPAGDGSLPEQLEQIASQLAAEYWDEHQKDILDIVDGSFLGEYAEFSIGAQFRSAAAVSMAYVLMSRCGLEAENYFTHEDFLNVFDFNTPDTLTELGTAVSQGSEAVLRQIEVTIKKYEREKSAERSADHGEHSDLPAGRGRPASQPDPGGAAEPRPGQVREDAPDVSEGVPSGDVQPPDAERDAVQPPAGDRGRGQPPVGADDAGAGENGGGNGTVEGQRPDEVGGADEHLQSPGGGNHPDGAGLQLNNELESEGPSAEAPGPSAVSHPEPERPVPASRGITDQDVDKLLIEDFGIVGRKQRIYALYQQGLSDEQIADHLRGEYNRHGVTAEERAHEGPCVLADGGNGYGYFVAAEWRLRRRDVDGPMRSIKYKEMAAHIRALIDEGRYLTPDELKKYESDRLGDVPEQGTEAPAPVSEPVPLAVTQADIDEQLHFEAPFTPQNLRIYDLFQQDLSVEARVEAVKKAFGRSATGHQLPNGMYRWTNYEPDIGITIQKSYADKKTETVTISWPDAEKRLRQLIAEGRYLTPEELEQYRQTHPDQMKLETASTPEAEPPIHVPGGTPPIPAPAPSGEITQADIDAALQEWNGDMDSKRRVQQYMTDHARDRGTAEWLKNEYGDDFPAYPVNGVGAATDLLWTKVQRHLARLVKEGRFFTEEEQDRFEDIDPAAIRDHLEQARDKPSAFVEQVMADVERIAEQEADAAVTAPPTVREIYDRYKPMVKELVLADEAYQNACRNSDRETAVFEGDAAVKRAALTITDPEFMRLYYDMPDFRYRLHREIVDETYPIFSQPQQEQAPDLSGQPITREGDTITIGNGDAAHEVEITVSDEEWQAIQQAIPEQPARDPLAPAYQVGDTVYLDKTAFEITDINLFDVQLVDPTLPLPLIRSESRDRFELLLRQDTRNGHITEFLGTILEKCDPDMRDVLVNHLLTQRDKDYISGWLRSGEGNTRIGQRLSDAFAGRSDTIMLQTGEHADYFTSTTGIEVHILDEQDNKKAALSGSWYETVYVFRTLYQQGLDGFTHEPIQRPTVRLEGKPAYQVGDKVVFPYGNQEISGTIGWIGETGIRIDAGPYSWSHETISRDIFEDALRQDERNTGLFVPEAPPAQEFTTETVAIYPAEPNHLPYDVVIQTLKIPEQERDQPEVAADRAPAAGNFHITDDNLGVGTPKEKFRRNMEAINTLQAIELEGRSATPAEQEILSRYVGWGGLPDAFDPDKPGWKDEFLELQAALTPEEYASARASTLNAHYTRPAIIKAIYEAVERMGFKTGNILEPSCGIGNFFGLLPESMAASRLYGVELDSITGRIAQQLYPKANISIQGFEKSDFPDGFFDLAIGNVPFGGYKLADRRYDRENLLIHDYFFAKTIDKVRAGGVIAFVTSNGIAGGTMDKKDRHAREYIARRCHLLGAIRLPNNASLANAGTEVGMDIMFLQKRDVPLTRDESLPGWVDVDVLEQHTYVGGDGVEKRGHVTMSRYFQGHPEMVLGTPEITSGPFGAQLVCKPIPGADLAQQLHDAVSNIRGEYREAETPELDADINEPEVASIPADPSVKNYSYAVVDGEVYYRQNSVMVKPNLTASAKERVKGMVELRDRVQQLIDMQMNEYTPDSAIQEKQAELSQLYDNFAKKFGLINDRGNRLAFSADSAYYLLCALEVLDENGKLERKADMFTKRTIKPHQTVTSADTAMDALAVSIGERACVDLRFMAQLTGKTEDALIGELRGVIFKDPLASGEPYEGWQTADEYLSGNVRQKLRVAEVYAASDPAYQANVEALTAAQPKDLDASEIEVRLGATWIDKQYIQQFMYETLRTPYHLKGRIKVSYSEHTAEWSISNKGSVGDNDIAAYSTYGTDRANAYRILEDSLNLRDVRIYDTVEDADGKEKRVLNAKETTLAAQKQQALRDAFREWIFKDPQRRQALVKQYNEEMNCIRPREYDGSHIVFSGINPGIELQPHQVNAIAHVLYGGNTLLAHEVGAGKTFEMIAAAMESKRLGLCHKSIFVVPNHLTEQTASEFMRLYPSTNILVTTKRDFEKHRRKKFCARIATGNYDAVIIGHSQFEKIPISYARQEQLIQDQIMEITEGIQEVKDSGGERFTVKQLERTRRNLEARLEKLQANHRKDDVVTFEQLGVDMMFVDESDNYKNLFLYTKMRNVAGLSTTDAQKSSDMFAKCRYLDEITNGRGVVFATGTPISNSMTEMYTIQRYLQYDRLQEMGMGHFDCWASRFGETVTALELAPEGTGFRSKTRFAKFYNLPELMSIWKEAADIQTADMLNLPTPEAEYITVTTEPSTFQEEMVAELGQRAEDVRNRLVEPSVDNMLRITSDGRKLALDQRLQNPLLPDDPNSKVNACVRNIIKEWRDSTDIRGTQLVFCDLSTPKGDGKFNVYDDIKTKLIAQGIPQEEIAFIHDANTEAQKAELFAKVRRGQVRVLIGSTQKMGAGTNVQDRIVASHDLDCPWRPADLEQRAGRSLRQGNMNKKVRMYKYVTKGTFDAYNWGLVENKQKFIGQVMTSKSPARSAEDVDATALSYAEVKALATGDDRIREKMDLDVQVAKLKMLKANHTAMQYEMQDKALKYYPQQMAETRLFIEALGKDLPIVQAHPVKDDAFTMTVMGQVFTERKAAGEAILKACMLMDTPEKVVDLGEYRGFPMQLHCDGFKFKVTMKQHLTYTADLSDDPVGNVTRINNALEGMAENLKRNETRLARLESELKNAQEEAERPFPKEEELRQKSARLTQLNRELEKPSNKGVNQHQNSDGRPNLEDGGAPARENPVSLPTQGNKPSIRDAIRAFTPPAPVSPSVEKGQRGEAAL